MILDEGWRLATGTLTAIPVPGAVALDRRTASAAMLLAPVAVVPLGLAVTVLGLLGTGLDLPAPALGLLAVGLLAWATRALHWDGLSDVGDGLTASFEAERSLAVMKTGTSGPAGTVAVVVVAGLQAVGLGVLLATTGGAILAGVLVLVSRCALTVTCAAPVRAARSDGLGRGFAGSVPVAGAVASWVLATGAVAVAGVAVGAGAVRPVAAACLALLAVVVLVRHTGRRFGGVTGDVYGAAIEIAFATLVVVAA